MARISFLGTAGYDPDCVQAAVDRHFALLDVRIPPEARVVVKPNLIMRAPPERAATTHPALVEAVVRRLQAMGVGEITIADSPGGLYTPQILAAAYETAGLTAVAERCGVRLNTACGSRPVRVEAGELCREFDLIDPVAEADFVVNLPKLKTHCMTTLSCGIKNLFGCVPGLLKPQLHYRFPDGERFARMLVDLSLLVKPGLTLVDAVEAMEGDGPTGGRRRFLGCTAAAAGMDFYALDLALAGMIGLSPDRVPMLAEAVRRGLCPRDAAEVEVLGDPVPRVPDFRMPATKGLDFTGGLPGPLAALVRRMKPLLAPRPVIDARACVGCGRCAESCPAGTILLEKGKARIDPSRCIHCFCCQELCPVRAVKIKTMPLFRFLS